MITPEKSIEIRSLLLAYKAGRRDHRPGALLSEVLKQLPYVSDQMNYAWRLGWMEARREHLKEVGQLSVWSVRAALDPGS